MRHLTTFRLIDQIVRTGSIRAAAHELSITPSAMQRRLQAFETELGEPIFERLPNGVRLNAVGELAIHHIRMQLSETERLRSKIADLSGIRRGHISIGCSQALVPTFLPKYISDYRARFPEVTFSVTVLSHQEAEQALEEFSVDIAIVFDLQERPKFQVLLAVEQSLMAIVSINNPLTQRKKVRLRECLEYPLVLPTDAFGGRQLLERAVTPLSLSLPPVIESNSFEFLISYILYENAVTFQIPIGLLPELWGKGLVALPIDRRDIASGRIFVGQRAGRILPVACARFADEISRELANTFETIN
jgi:DNA-binding transcriptional LysR family regulator